MGAVLAFLAGPVGQAAFQALLAGVPKAVTLFQQLHAGGITADQAAAAWTAQVVHNEAANKAWEDAGLA